MVPGALEAFVPALLISADDLAGPAEQRLDVAVKAWPGREILRQLARSSTPRRRSPVSRRRAHRRA
jgi:hypothetical protein